VLFRSPLHSSRMKSVLLAAVLVASASALPNIVQLAQSVPELSTLVTAVSAGGLVSTLEGAGPFTVFAPTNDAFNNLPAGVLANLLKPENKAQLVDILTYHVVAGNVQSGNLTNGELVPTVEGKNVSVNIETVGGVYLNVGTQSAHVIQANVEASNGVVHLIDAVLLPPSAPSTDNIVQLAQSVSDLSTLVTAVTDAGLAATLSGPGPFTVLAPTNEAFAALPAGVLDNLLKPENKAQLVDILTYHVVAGNVQSGNLTNGELVPTVEGKNVSVNIEAVGGVYLNIGTQSANVIQADVEASNGVVHLINAVLLPPSVQKHLQLAMLA